ncbi:leghemoglobin C2-like [Hibiscus syriacus]|uniref:Leghemoglobin C2-like n=1 Tax=Hibiscus syriacus TaxID=106335 RepID=A0A6A3AC56_HIBSY|nr:leghemoglobin C2-like [Hibiscus syriacus]
MTDFQALQQKPESPLDDGAEFERGLEELMRGHFDDCMSFASCSVSRSPDDEDDESDRLVRRRARSDIEGDDLAESSAARRRHSRILSRWAARQAQEMITTMERRNRESELIDLAGLHTVSMLDSSFLREPQSPTSRRQGGNVDRSSTQASAILQMWRELEDEHLLNREQRSADGNRTMSSITLSESHGSENQGSVGDVTECENDSATLSNDQGVSQNDPGNDNGSSREQSPDLGEVERERVRQIVRGWMESEINDHSSSVTQRAGSPRAEWLGETERERVRNVREWVQMTSQQRGVRGVQREDQEATIGAQVDHVPHNYATDQDEGQPEHIRRDLRRLRGRQAVIDLLVRNERERQRELQGLLEHRAVSDFAHRNRIQSLLRGRFLRNERPVEEERPPSVAASELSQLRQRHTVSGLREGFRNRLETIVRGQASASSETISSNVINDSRSELPQTNTSQNVQHENIEDTQPRSLRSHTEQLPNQTGSMVNNVLVVESISWQENANQGLRQGCSLSPILFNVVGELLHKMLSKAVVLGLFQGFSFGNDQNSFNLSHLQFADDLIIFCRASITQIKNVRRVLRIFGLMTGLHLNLAKSKLYGINMENDLLEEWARDIGCSIGSFPTVYLGLPLGAKKNSEKLWEPVIENFSRKLVGWKASSLSMAGRLVLIKSVLSSLPIFYLSIFKMPSTISQQLNSLMSNFLWGGGGEKKRMHWVSWKKICKPLSGGGLGVVDLNLTNRALLGKWVWKFANEKDSIWKKFFCCKHNVSCHSLDITKALSHKDSWIWRGIVNNFSKNDFIGGCLRSHAKIQIGNGESVSFWKDTWLGDCPLKILFPRIFALSTNKGGNVAAFGSFDLNGWEWNIKTRRNLCDWEVLQLVELLNSLKDIKLIESLEDCLLWDGLGDGLFSVKECRKSLESVYEDTFQWRNCVWLGLVPPRVETFLWQLSHQKVAVRMELMKRGVTLGEDTLCPFCNLCEESVQHLFLFCQVSWELWNKLICYWGISLAFPLDPPSLLSSWSDLRPSSVIWKFIPGVVLWSIWRIRNEIIFDNGKLDKLSLFFTVRLRLARWFLAKYPLSYIKVDSLIGDPSLADSISAPKELHRSGCGWIPPPVDFFKFNVDGACSRVGRVAGIGGLLRDWNRVTLISFSENVGPSYPYLAELKAVRRGIDIFVSSEWLLKGRLIIECDCKLVVDWIKDQALVPISLSNFVKEIVSIVSFRNFIVRWIPRSCNCEADKLAKEGIG